MPVRSPTNSPRGRSAPLWAGPPTTPTDAMSRSLFHVLAIVAEFEPHLIRLRWAWDPSVSRRGWWPCSRPVSPVARWPGGPVARWLGGPVARWPGCPGGVSMTSTPSAPDCCRCVASAIKSCRAVCSISPFFWGRKTQNKASRLMPGRSIRQSPRPPLRAFDPEADAAISAVVKYLRIDPPERSSPTPLSSYTPAVSRYAQGVVSNGTPVHLTSSSR